MQVNVILKERYKIFSHKKLEEVNLNRIIIYHFNPQMAG